MVLSKISLLMALLSTLVFASETEYSDSHARVQKFLAILVGQWDGEAIETPVGPVDYDIQFHRCDDGAFVGVADTGVSLHYWRFRERAGGKLSLRFLSTFRGNRNSILLLPSEPEGDMLRFYAPKLPLLTLAIAPTEDQIDVRVYHHQKPHVHIRLKRFRGQTALPRSNGDLCDRLPSVLKPVR